MAMDLLFCTDTPLDPEIYRVAAMKWAKQFANMTVKDINDGRIQLWYENEDTDVAFSISEGIGDWTDHLDEEKLEEVRGQIGKQQLSGWQFTLNYFRPNFFAREAMPYLAEFAEAIGFSILDPESAQIIPVDTEDLIELWTIQNRRAIASILFDDKCAEMTTYSRELDADGQLDQASADETLAEPYLAASNGMELTFVDDKLLNRCWEYNYIKARMQADTEIFIPKIMLLQLTRDQPFGDMFIWTRTVITAIPDTEHVLMAWTEEVSEDAEFKYGIARGKDLNKIIMAKKSGWSKHNGYLMPSLDGDPHAAAVELFDKCWKKIAKPHDPMKCAMLGGFMCVVETELVNALSADVASN